MSCLVADSGAFREDAAVTRGVQAISIIYQLTARVQALIAQSHLERIEGSTSHSYSLLSARLTSSASPAWQAYWLPLLHTLTSQCVNPCRAIRHSAFSALQRALLSPSLTASTRDGTVQSPASAENTEWTLIFSAVLFPLIHRLLKPEVYQSDPAGMADTRVQAATLVCKIFLHYLVLLSEMPATDGDGGEEGAGKTAALEVWWLRILDIMDRLMGSGQGDNLVCPLHPSLTSFPPLDLPL